MRRFYRSEYSIYHSVGQTFLYFLKGVLTLEKVKTVLETALKRELEKAIKWSSSTSKSTSAGQLMMQSY